MWYKPAWHGTDHREHEFFNATRPGKGFQARQHMPRSTAGFHAVWTMPTMATALLLVVHPTAVCVLLPTASMRPDSSRTTIGKVIFTAILGACLTLREKFHS